jgi:hypothetical protein
MRSLIGLILLWAMPTARRELAPFLRTLILGDRFHLNARQKRSHLAGEGLQISTRFLESSRGALKTKESATLT